MINIGTSIVKWLGKQCPAELLGQAQTLNRIVFDSRDVEDGDALIVLPSVAGDEAAYIEQALEKRAVLVIGEIEYSAHNYCRVSDVMTFAASVLNHELGSPSQHMDVIGVTGTNGKSSIVFYVAQLLTELRHSCAVMGTLGYGFWNDLKPTGMTTLPLPRLHQALADVKKDCKAIAMEVSSHGLHQKRLSGVAFNGAIFTNLSRDHLDYHGTMDAYFDAKRLLFKEPGLQWAVINQDDDYGKKLLSEPVSYSSYSYGTDEKSDLHFCITRTTDTGQQLALRFHGQEQEVFLPLLGEFNAYNAAASVLSVIAMGFDFSSACKAVTALRPVSGRMELIDSNDSQPNVLVDYAHTPDAVEQVLKSARKHCKGNLVCLVGCGGDRDRGKRPLMAQAAINFADSVLLTSDNPRSESPEQILADMVQGLKKEVPSELDRKQAIQSAILNAKSDDLIVIVGKGHEDYQEIHGVKYPFSDQETAREALQIRSQLRQENT
ncbi:UDP-N-acetylmuramoyl-L-alanyl-D-glutamate--2,6-diaminopimelate ligase [Bermanella marisrubri]|uniref:UDP-N-acetylmuramoyl-L-alanyl-D-glutamate--2,6-diaminopimelate ligase n=1 Tax=Bermanella marisrubri TaxID=207949 RepID=Q1MYB5_9GAMM|nr:UDP-N-acetylmuramoyl-L-alanyl-D-glutamate--2,6-diaminopimelate ligase [Bermanella marisrubri]EAT10952.1 UDP-N-acetylmuramoylalanyl-D-glutamate-2, 6-diaminopimelate ligase [Oceanobacter sp. RED65] [Bermanella marisrubri]QIZ85100.1 UDP-N-acetylmuramoyl-L-alanyl-D-glutamate--2,6-diaminopimelate ligase [Bermanella marisrubri]